MTFDRTKVMESAAQNFKYNANLYYGSAAGLSVGVGLFYNGIRYPAYNLQHEDYSTLEGTVYVLTHECDISQDNVRNFNDYVLVCPVINFSEWAETYFSEKGLGALMGYLPDLAKDNIFRAVLLPPSTELPDGGILYLNFLASVHVSEFTKSRAQALCALSSYAQEIIDRKIENHLLRPKTEVLPRLR